MGANKNKICVKDVVLYIYIKKVSNDIMGLVEKTVLFCSAIFLKCIYFYINCSKNVFFLTCLWSILCSLGIFILSRLKTFME